MLYFLGIYLAALLLFVALLMSLAELFWVFDNFINFIPQFLFLTVLCIIALLAEGSFWQALAMCCVFVFFAMPLVRVRYPGRSASVAGDRSLTVLQANVNLKNTKYDRLIKVIREAKPTMIMMNEVTAAWIDRVTKATAATHLYRIVLPSTTYRGMAVFSQWPIASHDVLELTKKNSPLIRVHMQDVPLTIYVAHPLPPMTPGWSSHREIFFKRLAVEVRKSTDDVLVVGDLNTTFFSPLLRTFLKTSGLKLDRQGFGVKTTWMRGTPLALPLDHILYRGSLTMTDLKVMSSIGSDHRPVLATFNYAR